MNKYFLLLFILLIQNTGVFSQTKVLSKSSKKNIVLKSSDSLIKVSGRGKTIELANDNALWFLNNEVIKLLKESLDTVNIVDKDIFLIKKRFEQKSIIDSLFSIKNTFDYYNSDQIVCVFWEELKNKKRGNIYYQYYLAYYLSDKEIGNLQSQYTSVSKLISSLYQRILDVKIEELSIQSLVSYQDTISKISNLFINEEKIGLLNKKHHSITNYLTSFSIRIKEHEKGVFSYEVYNPLSNKVFLVKKPAKIISNCVQINNVLTSSKSNTVYYNTSKCSGDKQLIKVSIPFTDSVTLSKVVNVNPENSSSKVLLLSDLQLVWKKKYYKGYIKIKFNSEVNAEFTSVVKLDMYGDKLTGKLIKPKDLISNNEYLVEFTLPNYAFKNNDYIWHLTLFTIDKLNGIEKPHDFYKVNYFQN